jgi:Trk K+ transport system NAD-binding subunit
MVGRRRLIRYYAAAFAGAVVFFTLAYDFGMSFFEGRPRTLLHSFEVVMQTFTTTGYGQDAGWGPEMTLLVVWMQFTSLVLIFAAFPIVIVPLVEDALATSPPTALEGVEGHVIVCRHSPRTETLREELAARDVPAVLVEPDRETATDLFERNRRVVHGEPDSVETLRGARVEDALAVVADDDDEVDLSIAMSVGEAAPDVPVYSIVDDPAFETYHRHAGVEEAFSPRTLLGRGLANKITTAVSTELEGGVEIGRDFSIGELPLHPGSALCDQTFAESGLTDRTGARVIGAWSTGEFRTPPFPDLVLDEHTVLLVVGGEKDLERLRELTRSTVRRHRRNEVVIAGYGVVGSTVANALAEAGVPRTVVDVEGKSTVDVVGDATDPEVLREAGIGGSRARRRHDHARRHVRHPGPEPPRRGHRPRGRARERPEALPGRRGLRPLAVERHRPPARLADRRRGRHLVRPADQGDPRPRARGDDARRTRDTAPNRLYGRRGRAPGRPRRHRPRRVDGGRRTRQPRPRGDGRRRRALRRDVSGVARPTAGRPRYSERGT